MNKFIQHLKEKGYKIYGNKAVLLETEFNICEGYKTTAMGRQKSYWLELEWNDDLVRKDIKKYMIDCKFLVIEDATSYHGDVFDHPNYKYTCEKCKQEIIPFLYCNEEKCKNYTKKSEWIGKFFTESIWTKFVPGILYV